MTDNTQAEAGSTHIIRYALEMGLLWIDGDGRDKVREALDALDTLEAQLASIGAGGVSALMGAAKAGSDGVASLPLPGAQEAVAWAMFADNGNLRLWSKKPMPHPDAIPLYAAPQPAAPYSMDADPQGIRATVADAITGALAFGAQGVNRPPEGHWLAPFWNAAREDMAAPQPALSAGWVSAIEAVAKMLKKKKKADDFAEARGSDDMGGLSFGCGAHADAKLDYHSGLLELAEEVRALPASPTIEGESK